MPRLSKSKAGFTAWAVVVFAFLYIPILVMVLFAFNRPSAFAISGFHGNFCDLGPDKLGNIAVWNGFTTCWFSAGLHDPDYIPAIGVSLEIAFGALGRAKDPAAPALESPLTSGLVQGLALGDDDQQPP